MNKKQMQQQVGKLRRLRPKPLHIDPADGSKLEVSDDDDLWSVEAVAKDGVRLKNVGRGQLLEIQADNIREFRSPDFLMLRCQVQVRGESVTIEPIVGSRLTEDERFIRLETLMPDLLTEMREDLAVRPLAREFVVYKSNHSYWGRGHELAYHPDKIPDLRSKLHVLENEGLIQDIAFNDVPRFRITEPLAAYVAGG